MAKKKAKKSVLHQPVHPVWGWAIFTLGAFVIIAMVGVVYMTY
jgi:hypothetical protein